MMEKRFNKKKSVDEEARLKIIGIIQDYLLNRKEVVFAYLYGSFAREEPFRDIDVALYLENIKKEIDIESDLSLELTQIVKYPVDVRIINRAPIHVKMAVLRTGTVLVNNSDDLRTDVIEDVGRRYREYSHFRNIAFGIS